MRNIWIMTLSTLREAMSKKVFLFFMGISAVVLIIQLISFSFISADQLIKSINPMGLKMPMLQIVSSFELMVVSPLAVLGLLMAIFSSSSFIPTMLEKGNIDLLLSKPVTRTELVLGKYLGGLLVVFINVFFLVFGVWLIISVKFGYWDPTFLSVSLVITFTFAVLYSMIVLFGIITQGSVFGMMMAYFTLLILSPLLFAAKDKFLDLINNVFLKNLIKGCYYIVPKTSELMGNILISITSGKTIESFQPVITSLVFLILMLVFSIIIFRKKDF
ncbi:MAG: ABC transporter permease subunit [Ignavibacteriaceae bacterium]|nr:ABC transporter permease subunit [Ignavibacteriaceae bacterium]